MLKHSLISDGVFQVTGADGAVACLSLPQVLARLSAGEDLGFDALRPHQRPAWHAFLVQLAYLALEGEDEPVPPTSAEAWCDKLRALTPGHDDDAPWCLVNSDWQRPAFMQPPCSVARMVDFKRTADSAQDIDVLVTARHHDEKTGKLPLTDEALDGLVFALISLQGWSSFMGAGNYNTMRMNGGFSSRPQFRLTFGPRGAGTEFLRDLQALLDARESLFDDARALGVGIAAEPPHQLLWLLPWDSGSLPLESVHPLCLEVCRRVRLVVEGGRLLLRRAASDAMRVAAKEQRGCVLDPWVPLMNEDPPKALTAQSHTLGYRTLQGLLFDRNKALLPRLAMPSQRERRANQHATLVAQVLVSGDGRTDGFLSREVAMSAPVLSRLLTDEAAMARRSQRFVDLAGQAAGKAYRSALLQFVDGSDDVDFKNRDFTRAVEPWVERYEQAIDEVFFTHLFDGIDRQLDAASADREWVVCLQAAAQTLLLDAMQSLPTREPSRLLAQARAERFFWRSWNKQFGAILGAATNTVPETPVSPSSPTTSMTPEPTHD